MPTGQLRRLLNKLTWCEARERRLQLRQEIDEEFERQAAARLLTKDEGKGLQTSPGRSARARMREATKH
jgi:hypothetical protein